METTDSTVTTGLTKTAPREAWVAALQSLVLMAKTVTALWPKADGSVVRIEDGVVGATSSAVYRDPIGFPKSLIWEEHVAALAAWADQEEAALRDDDLQEDEVITVTPQGREALNTARAAQERHDFLVGVLMTFAENPYSWFNVRRYKWTLPELSGGTAPAHPNGWSNATGEVRNNLEEEGEPNGPWLTLDAALVEKGFELMKAGPVVGLHESGRARILGQYAILDAGNLDVNDADVILQIAVLGEVIYG